MTKITGMPWRVQIAPASAGTGCSAVDGEGPRVGERTREVTAPGIEPLDLEVLARATGRATLMPYGAAVSKPKCAYQPGSPSEDDRGFVPLVGRDEHGGDQGGTDALALPVGGTAIGPRATERPCPMLARLHTTWPTTSPWSSADERQGVEHVPVGAKPVEDVGLGRVA